MLQYKLEHLFSFCGKLAIAPEIAGRLPDGIRTNLHSTGGDLVGPKLRGHFRSIGDAWTTARIDGVTSSDLLASLADRRKLGPFVKEWLTLRKDSVAVLDACASFETHDGAVVQIDFPGTIQFGVMRRDQFPPREWPPVLKFQMSPRFETTNSDYRWLNELVCFGVGEVCTETNNAKYDIYAIR